VARVPLPTRGEAAPVALLLCLAVLLGGCKSPPPPAPIEGVPRELRKTSMPDYVIEPPDVLELDMITAVPKPPYRVQPLDGLTVRATDTPPDSPIFGVYQVELDGNINLGPFYGAVPVAGKTIPEVKKGLEDYLLKFIKKTTVEVALAQGRGMQQVRGQHLVRGDGSIGLGSYGSVRVVDMTIADAKKAIEAHLSTYFQNPEVSLDVSGFNSKVYYIISDTGGSGLPMQRVPLTGNETVLDALSTYGGIISVSDSRQIWIARASDGGCCTTLPVDLKAITECADARTNYQIIAGDRVFVRAYPLTAYVTRAERFLYPIERALGVTLLGAGVVRSINNVNNNNYGNVGVIR
jgi:polysaccharide export outer membrane protein